MIRLVNVDDKYINFLHKYDNKVMYNKGHKRPYIGILFQVRGHNYFAPLSSPKPKFSTMKNDVDFMRIQGGKLGAINFNNMIPVANKVFTVITSENITDIKYKMLLINQIKFFREYETEIINKDTKLYKSYKKNTLREAVRLRCCNFFELEKAAKKYNPNFKYKPKKEKESA